MAEDNDELCRRREKKKPIFRPRGRTTDRIKLQDFSRGGGTRPLVAEKERKKYYSTGHGQKAANGGEQDPFFFHPGCPKQGGGGEASHARGRENERISRSSPQGSTAPSVGRGRKKKGGGSSTGSRTKKGGESVKPPSAKRKGRRKTLDYVRKTRGEKDSSRCGIYLLKGEYPAERREVPLLFKKGHHLESLP